MAYSKGKEKQSAAPMEEFDDSRFYNPEAEEY